MNRPALYLGLPGAAALAVVAIAAQAQGGAGELSIGSREGLTRLAFAVDRPAAVNLAQSGDTLTLAFNRPLDLEIVRLRVGPPRYVKTAQRLSKPGENLRLEIVLEEGVRVRRFNEDGRVVLDLAAPPAKEAETAAVKPATGDPTPKTGVVKVGFAEAGGEVRLSFAWAAPARAAVFMREEAAWIVFDAKARLDLAEVARRGRLYTDVRAIEGDGVTALRLTARRGLQLQATAEGPVWTVTLGERQRPGAAAVAARKEPGPDGAGQLSASFGRDGAVRWVDDPVVGDRFAAALIPGPTLGIAATRATLQAALGQSAHGALIDPRADGLSARLEDGELTVRRGDGLIASYRTLTAADTAPTAAIADTPSLGSYGLLDLAGWAEAGGGLPRDVIARLTAAAADEGVTPGAPVDARMRLARYLLASDLAPEALGALKIAATGQPELEIDPEFRLMRAAANTMMGRLREAGRDLAASSLAKDPAAALWRGYAAGLSGDWLEARRNLEAGRDALAAQPPRWRVLFLAMLAEAALEQGDLGLAETSIAAAAGEAKTTPLRARTDVLRARLLEARGQKDEALKVFLAAAAGPDEASAVRATLEAAELRLEQGASTPEALVEELEALRFRWRGDALELETMRALGAAYIKMGRWRQGLNVMRAGALAFAEHPAAREVRIEMATVFEDLYLEGKADALEPIESLGLFYEFKDLTPFGPDGDRLIRRLAGRLVEADLLEQAAELLRHQVEKRLEGLAQAEIALDLAGVYMADKKPEHALAILNATRQPRLPAELASQRRVMEASALMALERFDHALEIVEKDKSRAAELLRAEVAYRSKDWPRASDALALVLPPALGGPLSPDERGLVLRASVAAALAGRNDRLAALERTYGARMGEGGDADILQVLAGEPGAEPGPLREAARRIARTDLMDRFMADVRARLSAKGLPEPAETAVAEKKAGPA